jgi:hypothetical protein
MSNDKELYAICYYNSINYRYIEINIRKARQHLVCGAET